MNKNVNLAIQIAFSATMKIHVNLVIQAFILMGKNVYVQIIYSIFKEFVWINVLNFMD